ncbi:LysR family transcriptional regulator [Pseudonocardia abyssalis]|uniref:LysR family transcriptional regulator n=1 Tax=Pseudonocardia abyssalis TaxID=2792008 RepID=A0ABS6UMB4_9PSEU|nr:LysR family transcriptional regulator [Pseudonocardia abyssalis]MBW0116992.1 LysR family transcriptional regulator [Pseudonocardia abyssalis]MBW0133076.1 LysR family transcriptional regulator [Pseudonocardia abyssalis]
MDVRSLRYAVTLADTLHFGRAAQAHWIAAQPFGRRIQALEREIGEPLFARTSRRVVLTPAGERFLPRARQVLAQLDALLAPAEGCRDEPGVLRIGVLGFGLADLWPDARELVGARLPDLALSTVELAWEDQYDAVRSGEVDVAIVHDVGGADDLVLDRALEMDRYAVVPVGSDLAGADRLTATDVDGRRWVSPVGGVPGLAEWGDTSGRRGSVDVRSPSGIPTAVATSGWLGLHGEPARRFFPHPGVRYVPMEGPGATVSVASRPDDRRESVAVFRAAAHAVAAVALPDRNRLGP